MKKFALWAGGILGLLLLCGVCLVFFYPDQKLEPFDDLKLNLPKISEDQNGYKYVLEAYKAFNVPEGVESPASNVFNEFFKSGKLEDVKKLPDYYLLLKANSKVFESIDRANEFEYLIPDMNLEEKIWIVYLKGDFLLRILRWLGNYYH